MQKKINKTNAEKTASSWCRILDMKGTQNLFSYSKAVIYSEFIFISPQLLVIASFGKGYDRTKS